MIENCASVIGYFVHVTLKNHISELHDNGETEEEMSGSVPLGATKPPPYEPWTNAKAAKSEAGSTDKEEIIRSAHVQKNHSMALKDTSVVRPFMLSPACALRSAVVYPTVGYRIR